MTYKMYIMVLKPPALAWAYNLRHSPLSELIRRGAAVRHLGRINYGVAVML